MGDQRMGVGTLEQLFEFELQGVEFPEPTKLRVQEYGLEAQLQPGTPLSLHVRVDGVAEVRAEQWAGSFVQELYRRLLLRFGANIESSAPPRCVRRTFTPHATTSALSVANTSITHSADAYIIVRPVLLPADEVAAVARDVELRVGRPESATSAQLCTATAMYAAGLESKNKVVRFLILYSALDLAARFKLRKGWQDNVDSLLLGVNPKLAALPRPARSKKKETLYTKLRNDFIHAEGEGRGTDPVAAIKAIEAQIEQFQRDVSLVISNR